MAAAPGLLAGLVRKRPGQDRGFKALYNRFCEKTSDYEINMKKWAREEFFGVEPGLLVREEAGKGGVNCRG